MIDSSLSTLRTIDVTMPDGRTLEHILPPIERLKASSVPLMRLRDMDEDTYEEVVQVWAYMCLKADGRYARVCRVGGAGDKGRDVIAYLDDKFDTFDLFQCKHYKSELTYNDLYGEIGKLLTYTYKKTYPVPKHYFIACPYGLAQSFRDMLQDGAKKLKMHLISDWDNKVVVKVGVRNGIELDDQLRNYINKFDFSIIMEKSPLSFIEEFRDKGAPYFFWYFGGGWNAIKKTNLEIPDMPAAEEQNYITRLYEAYSEHSGFDIKPDNISDLADKIYIKHLDRSRSLFYSAEEIRLTSRSSTPPDCDEFEELKSQINIFIGDTYDDNYSDGFTKVKKVVEKAGEYNHSENLLIGQFLDSNAKRGICHHLSNEGILTWKTRK